MALGWPHLAGDVHATSAPAGRRARCAAIDLVERADQESLDLHEVGVDGVSVLPEAEPAAPSGSRSITKSLA